VGNQTKGELEVNSKEGGGGIYITSLNSHSTAIYAGTKYRDRSKGHTEKKAPTDRGQ
jgi:hypothetical protein